MRTSGSVYLAGDFKPCFLERLNENLNSLFYDRWSNQKIAERLADVITHEVELISLKDQAVDFAEKLQNADQIVIGASIRYGHFNPLVYQFVEQHYPALNAKKTAFTV